MNVALQPKASGGRRNPGNTIRLRVRRHDAAGDRDVRAVRYPDGAIVNGTGAAESGYTTVASVKAGDIVALYGTGFGPANSAPVAGAVYESLHSYARGRDLVDLRSLAVPRSPWCSTGVPSNGSLSSAPNRPRVLRLRLLPAIPRT